MKSGAIMEFTLISCHILLWTLFAGSFTPAQSGENRYAVSAIPVNLRKDAHAVIRENTMIFEVNDRQRARLKVTMAVTIFQAEGREHGAVALWYNSFNKIKHLDGWIFDSGGKEIRGLNDSDMHDFSDISSYSLYEDARQTTAELYYDRYPYTVAYTYEIELEGFLNWPAWIAQSSDEPVEHSRFEVLIPATDELRYWTNRDSAKPAITLLEGKKHYLWEAHDLPELQTEMLDEDIEQRTTVVLTAPSTFQLDKYPGELTSWKAFGQWYNALSQERDRLPESAVQDIRKIIGPTDAPMEKVRKIFRYMQSRTRYVNVQLGVGGWQPFDATYVHERGYGDCKALSNYTVALLKQAGVTAFPVLVHNGKAGDLYVEDFPSSQFNHVIVCVPLEKDSVWLECTSQNVPVGHLGQYTENRFALLVTPQGGTLVQTPRSFSADNVQQRTAVVRLNVSGTAQARVHAKYTGNQQDYVRESLAHASPEDRERWLLNDLQVQNTHLDSYRIEGLDTHDREVSISMQLSVSKYASSSGTRIFFEPNLTERRTVVPRNVVSRRSPVHFSYPYLDIDSICFHVPVFYSCEALPKDVTLASSFGSFRARTTRIDDTTVVYTRSLEVREPSVPAERYQEYRKFFADIVKADRAQAVLVRTKP